MITKTHFRFYRKYKIVDNKTHRWYSTRTYLHYDTTLNTNSPNPNANQSKLQRASILSGIVWSQMWWTALLGGIQMTASCNQEREPDKNEGQGELRSWARPLERPTKWTTDRLDTRGPMISAKTLGLTGWILTVMAATCRGSQALQVPVVRTPEDSSFTKWQAYEESNAMEAAQIIVRFLIWWWGISMPTRERPFTNHNSSWDFTG